jgi:hypothetical protein
LVKRPTADRFPAILILVAFAILSLTSGTTLLASTEAMRGSIGANSNLDVASTQITTSNCEATGVGAPWVELYQANVTGLTVTIDGYAVAGIVSNVTWSWGDGQTSLGYFPQSHTYAKPGTYEVNITLFDCTGGGKTASASQVVKVGMSSPAQFYVPLTLAVGVVVLLSVVIVVLLAVVIHKSRSTQSKALQ